VAVPANLLSSTISNISPTQEVTLSTDEQNLILSSGNTKTTIATIPDNDFPIIPKITTSELKISNKDLIKGIKSVAVSASISSIKPELGSVYIYQNSNQLFFVATDSFRLAEYNLAVSPKIELPPILLPIKNIPEIIRFLEGGDEVSVAVTEHQISFTKKNAYLTSRLIEGNFPDYRQIIPKSASTTATILKNDFLSALRLASVFSGSFQQIRLAIDPKKKQFLISSKSDVGSGNESLKAELSGDAVELSFNHRYLVDGLSAFDGESVTISFHGTGKAAVIRSAKESLMYLVMPMNR
jgi:DNA polymerase-3 subunit beta